MDLPDNEFEYDEFVREEFGPRLKPAGIKTIWWVTAILLIVVSVAIYLLAGR